VVRYWTSDAGFTADVPRDALPRLLQETCAANKDTQEVIRKAKMFSKANLSESEDMEWSRIDCCAKPALIPRARWSSTFFVSTAAIWDAVVRRCEEDRTVSVIRSAGDVAQTVEKVHWSEIVRASLEDRDRHPDVVPQFTAVVNIDMGSTDPAMVLPLDSTMTLFPQEGDQNVTADIGFSGGHVSVHMDHGFSSLSILEGKCEKLWICAPPSRSNIKAFLKHSRKVETLVGRLSKVALFHQTSSEVMFLPAGTLRAAFTLVTGVMWGNRFKTYQDVWGATAGLIGLFQRRKREKVSKAEKHAAMESWLTFMASVMTQGTTAQQRHAAICLRSNMFRSIVASGDWKEPIAKLVQQYCPDLNQYYSQANDKTSTSEENSGAGNDDASDTEHSAEDDHNSALNANVQEDGEDTAHNREQEEQPSQEGGSNASGEDREDMRDGSWLENTM